jgi:hypothetical protein
VEAENIRCRDEARPLDERILPFLQRFLADVETARFTFRARTLFKRLPRSIPRNHASSRALLRLLRRGVPDAKGRGVWVIAETEKRDDILIYTVRLARGVVAVERA